MADFDKYAPKLSDIEGGWVDDPDDNGGATNRGVTLTTYRAFFGLHKTKEDLKNMPDHEWRFIMKSFWDECSGDHITNQTIAEFLVDWRIHSGGIAIRKIQAAFSLKPDGIVGPLTLGALNVSDCRTTLDRMKACRIRYYNWLIDSGRCHKKYRKGWINRVNSFQI